MTHNTRYGAKAPEAKGVNEEEGARGVRYQYLQ